MKTPITDLNPGDRYHVGDPADPANWVTVTDWPHLDQVTTRGRTVAVLRVPVRTADGTLLNDDYPDPSATVTTQ